MNAKLTESELDHAIAAQQQAFCDRHAGPEPTGPLAALNPSGYRPSDWAECLDPPDPEPVPCAGTIIAALYAASAALAVLAIIGLCEFAAQRSS